MEYPQEFSKQAKARVEGAMVEAVRALILQKGVKTDFRNPTGAVFDYVASVFYAYMCEVCELGRSGQWDVDRVDREVRRVIHSIAVDAETECRHYSVDLPIFQLFGSMSLSSLFWTHFKAMPAWQNYQLRLGEIAQFQSGTQDSLSESASSLPAQREEMKCLANRATWLRERLRERQWSPNTPSQFGGPDHKTIKRILVGLPVQDGTIDKLLIALNKTTKWEKLRPEHVPSD